MSSRSGSRSKAASRSKSTLGCKYKDFKERKINEKGMICCDVGNNRYAYRPLGHPGDPYFSHSDIMAKLGIHDFKGSERWDVQNKQILIIDAEEKWKEFGQKVDADRAITELSMLQGLPIEVEQLIKQNVQKGKLSRRKKSKGKKSKGKKSRRKKSKGKKSKGKKKKSKRSSRK